MSEKTDAVEEGEEKTELLADEAADVADDEKTGPLEVVADEPAEGATDDEPEGLAEPDAEGEPLTDAAAPEGEPTDDAEANEDAPEADEAEDAVDEAATDDADSEAEPAAEPEADEGKDAPEDAGPDSDSADAPAQAPGEERAGGLSLPTSAWVVIAVVALAMGVALGHFLLGGGSTVALAGRTTLSEGELDSTIATYTHGGVTYDVTARDVLTYGGAELTMNDEGTYDVPTASSILAYAQTQLMLDDAEKRGITVSDDDITEFLASSYGEGVDLATFASGTGMSEEVARDMLVSYVTISKLGEEITEGTLPDEMPVQPTTPAEGEEDTPTAEYAQYVIALLGDEWDADANTWARTDGSYYATLSSYEITNDSATYAAASAAYSIALSAYQEAYTQAAEMQNAYTDELFSNSTIQIGTLVG